MLQLNIISNKTAFLYFQVRDPFIKQTYFLQCLKNTCSKYFDRANIKVLTLYLFIWI